MVGQPAAGAAEGAGEGHRRVRPVVGGQPGRGACQDPGPAAHAQGRWPAMILIYLILLGPYFFCLSFAVPAAAMLTAIGYAVAIPGCYVVGLFRVLAVRPESLPSPRMFRRQAADAEPAVRGYFYGPAFAEVEQVAKVAFEFASDLVERGWKAVGISFEEGFKGKRLITVPLAIGAGAGMVAGIAVGAVGFAAIAVVHTVVAAVVLVAIRITGVILRGVDSGLLRIKNIRMTCPHCFERVPYPASRCSGRDCSRLHRDVRPGSYGLFRRRCLCGARLPRSE